MIKIICMTINHKTKLHNSDSCIVKKIQVRTLNCVYNTIESAEGVCKRDWVIAEPNRGLTWHQSQRVTTHTLIYAEMPKQADLMHLQGIIK